MKLALATTLRNRDATTDKDALILNGLVEGGGDTAAYVEKRPALDSAYELTAGTGQALYVPTTTDPDNPGVPGVIIDDILTRAPTAKTKRLRFGVQPSTANLNTAFSPSVTVTIRDSVGNIVNSTADVTVALLANATGATLGGTLTQAAVAGTATFNDLTLNRSGAGFTLRATSTGLNSATSDTFDLPTHLTFTVQPSGNEPNVTLDPVEVTVQDTAGNTDTNYNGNITISLYANSSGGVLSGTLTVAAVAGIASFANLEIDIEGTYSLKAVAEEISTCYPPALQISDSFSISPYSLTSGFFDNSPFSEIWGYSVAGGITTPPTGSITPTTFNGQTIRVLAGEDIILFGLTASYVSMSGLLAQSFWTSITVNGQTLLSANASSYFQGAGFTQWNFDGVLILNSTGDFGVSIS